jgi:hypothetical protein
MPYFKNRLFALILLSLAAPMVQAADGPVTWVDPTCGYFVVKLPEGNPAEAFGLFSLKANPLPEVGDTLGGDLVGAAEVTLENVTKGTKHDAIHWASAKSQEQLVRNTPVQCASKWKRKKK